MNVITHIYIYEMQSIILLIKININYSKIYSHLLVLEKNPLLI